MHVSAQKYKVFFNKVCVEFAREPKKRAVSTEFLIVEFDELISSDKFEEWINSGVELNLVTYSSSPQILFEKFQGRFKVVPAAGGVVENSAGLVLCIYRNGLWDLPKGKIEMGEGIRECAIREVEEETGVEVSGCNQKEFHISYHVYVYKNEYILKPTFWYKMYSDSTKFKPQNEEGITSVQWFSVHELHLNFKQKTFRSLAYLINCYLGE